MAIIKILLPFDDGPHALAGPTNYTRMIIKALDAQGIVGAFFVQTRAVDKRGTPIRMSTNEGTRVVQEANGVAPNFKHLIAIHTGSVKDHEKHWKRVAAPPDLKIAPNAQNGLESDLFSSINDIESLTKLRPKFVRPTGFELTNPKASLADRKAMEQAVLTTYGRLALTPIGVDLDSYDNTLARWENKMCRRPTNTEVVAKIGEGTPSAFRLGPRELIVLFHDINNRTAASVGQYIQAVSNGVSAQGHTPSFTSSRAEVINLLTQTTITNNESWQIPTALRRGCG
jgi:hypothetical protein